MWQRRYHNGFHCETSPSLRACVCVCVEKKTATIALVQAVRSRLLRTYVLWEVVKEIDT